MGGERTGCLGGGFAYCPAEEPPSLGEGWGLGSDAGFFDRSDDGDGAAAGSCFGLWEASAEVDEGLPFPEEFCCFMAARSSVARTGTRVLA